MTDSEVARGISRAVEKTYYQKRLRTARPVAV